MRDFCTSMMCFGFYSLISLKLPADSWVSTGGFSELFGFSLITVLKLKILSPLAIVI